MNAKQNSEFTFGLIARFIGIYFANLKSDALQSFVSRMNEMFTTYNPFIFSAKASACNDGFIITFKLSREHSNIFKRAIMQTLSALSLNYTITLTENDSVMILKITTRDSRHNGADLYTSIREGLIIK